MQLQNLFLEYVSTFVESFATDGHGWQIERVAPTHNSRGRIAHHFYNPEKFTFIPKLPTTQQLLDGGFRTQKDKKGRIHFLQKCKQTDWKRDPVGPYLEPVLDAHGQICLNDEGQEIWLGYQGGIEPDDYTEDQTTDGSRWKIEQEMFDVTQQTLNRGENLASQDAADRRADRFVQEQNIALNSTSSKKMLDIAKDYKAAWTRYRGAMLISREMTWLTRAQWECVERIYADGLRLDGREVKSQFNGQMRPAIHRLRLSTKDVKKYWKRSLAHFEENKSNVKKCPVCNKPMVSSHNGMYRICRQCGISEE